jgi:hypothetical protein
MPEQMFHFSCLVIGVHDSAALQNEWMSVREAGQIVANMIALWFLFQLVQLQLYRLNRTTLSCSTYDIRGFVSADSA